MRNRATTPLKIQGKGGALRWVLRQSWSKYNLYNMSRMTNPSVRQGTIFQLKWRAKSACRKYHGEQIREKQWVRMFDRRLRSVIPMNAEYLASNDGALESAGRGSGLERTGREGRNAPKPQAIPYMQMTFAPMERRLDTAIFRAMFASSARQARQFVVHGAVKVNGKQLRYPGYLLNPGDMFQVLPERVMYATGAPKIPEAAKEAEESEGDEKTIEENIEEQPDEEVEMDRDPREVLKDLKAQAKSILASPKKDLGAKRKQDLRAFSKAIKRLLSKSKSTTIMTESLEVQFAEIQRQLNLRRQTKETGISSPPSAQDPTQAPGEESSEADSAAETGEAGADTSEQESLTLTNGEYNELFDALRSMQENPIDESKPYATPWMPRDYMSAFAFIPRYLEVNHNICTAVYLRHPVARPGLAEVPTPFSETTNSTAFAWYLRRR
ncbi:uncharacterized protein Z518_02131 [Rhinocladiella mackenziei CBS 650.93]|uniref:RNA-binding S4 domain-containing protein n=1 Tax=Rhinocladiella mackenziei CBS 650.93 TaxID=1442369 RepID=A0A0D2HAI8_9EURO|nr:uncharacterized protein Z518_02131 [Rhinocladiella mackenziei CBS 650.93]KIX07478.1 hypothetical protein Z518_02131 [Rhinocladiella mackenziei CBS 650.93]